MTKQIEDIIEYIKNNHENIESIAIFEKGKYSAGDRVGINSKYDIEIKEKEYKIVVL